MTTGDFNQDGSGLGGGEVRISRTEADNANPPSLGPGHGPYLPWHS